MNRLLLRRQNRTAFTQYSLPVHHTRHTLTPCRARAHLNTTQSIRTASSQGWAPSRGRFRASSHFRPDDRVTEASLSPYFALFAIVTTTAVLVDYLTSSEPTKTAIDSTQADSPPQANHETPPSDSQSTLDDDLSSLFASMPLPSGTVNNLTPDQEHKLKEFWALTLKTFGITDPSLTNGSSERPMTPTTSSAAVSTGPESGKKEKRGLFHRKNKTSESTSSVGGGVTGGGDPEDKYGQTAELQSILASSSPADLRAAFWSMVKKDHPDALLLRFLRARKWDIHKALAMLVSTMNWRRNEMHVDDDIMLNGEGGALRDSQSSDSAVKKEATDFLAQMRLGKSFMHGIDKEGRPCCFVRVRLHRGGEQSERALERYTVYVIETCRLVLQPPVETATIVFDMTSFTMANMDYTPVKFMIKVFEANYPESLGCVLVHKAPWIFQGIWKIIRGWLDPVVAAKVHFTNNVEDLSEFINKSQITKDLGGGEDWEYKFIEPVEGENSRMDDQKTRQELEAVRAREVAEYENVTFNWIQGQDVRGRRDEIAQRLRSNYWALDPMIRARSLYDRTGLLGRDGQINYYPSQTVKTENLRPTHPNGVPVQQVGADDVD